MRTGLRFFKCRASTQATILVSVLTSSLLTACGEAEPALQVGPISYTEDELLGLSDERRKLLANLVGVGLAIADSTGAALGAPRVSEWLDDRRLEMLAAELTLEKHGIEDAVLEAQYLTNPEWELTVRHILFFSERWRSAEHRAEAAAKADRALQSLSQGADFAETAATLSEEPGAEGRQGLLTPGREGSWVPEFWAAALALEAGQISPVTETEYGYHILRLEDRQTVPFEEARSLVARVVADQLDDPEAVLDEWEGPAEPAARRAALLAEAQERALVVPGAERSEIERAWSTQMYQWSAALGFRMGMSASQVRQAALDALSDPGQGVQLARREVAADRAMIEASYPPVYATER